jgi:hypothetical protein
MDCVFQNFNTFCLRHNCCKPCFLDYRLWSSGSWNLAEDSLWGLRFIVTPICPFKCRLVGHSGRHYYLHTVISRVLWLLVPEQVHVSHIFQSSCVHVYRRISRRLLGFCVSSLVGAHFSAGVAKRTLAPLQCHSEGAQQFSNHLGQPAIRSISSRRFTRTSHEQSNFSF